MPVRRNDGPWFARVSSDAGNRVPRPGARPTDDLLPAVHGHSHRHRPRPRNEIYGSRRFGDLRGRVRWDRVPGDRADAPVPPEIPALVVRLELGPDALWRAGLGVPRASAGRVSVDGRGTGRAY